MFCGKCGTKAGDNDRYCMNCGNRLINVPNVTPNATIKYVSCYSKADMISYIFLNLNIVLFILSLLPINKIYMGVIIGLSIAAITATIIKYRNRKDSVLFFSILLACGSLYTSLGWLYYLFVK